MTTTTPQTIETSLDLLRAHPVVAIVRLDDLSQAEGLTHALLEGGIRALEFTLTNAAAAEVVGQLRSRISLFDAGEALIGVGSIRTAEHTRQAIDNGAQFLVSPVMVHEMLELGRAAGIPTMPGAFTPTEIETAQQAGASVVKVFPASVLGPSYLRAILAPMPELRLMPTGGVSLGNIADYLRAGAMAVGVGGELVAANRVANQEWDEITRTASSYVQAAAAAVSRGD
jgi:2-dehydro-3-deoxyphosphogluconate aldolase/(4S)-4-hydroxy-2-oxoglutarate aldolase